MATALCLIHSFMPTNRDVVVTIELKISNQGANPRSGSYNARGVKIFNARSSLVRFETIL
jgi:hypothetical protein